MSHRDHTTGRRFIRQPRMEPWEHEDSRPSSAPADCRASVTCGIADHPRVVLVTRDEHELSRLERSYRCARCGRPDSYTAAQVKKFARLEAAKLADSEERRRGAVDAATSA